MTACAATSMKSGGEPARRCGKASARRGAAAAINKTWCNTRTENSADDNAQSGETKITSISPIAPQPARVSERSAATNRKRQGSEHCDQQRIQIPARPEIVRDSGGTAVGDHEIWHDTAGFPGLRPGTTRGSLAIKNA